MMASGMKELILQHVTKLDLESEIKAPDIQSQGGDFLLDLSPIPSLYFCNPQVTSAHTNSTGRA